MKAIKSIFLVLITIQFSLFAVSCADNSELSADDTTITANPGIDSAASTCSATATLNATFDNNPVASNPLDGTFILATNNTSQTIEDSDCPSFLPDQLDGFDLFFGHAPLLSEFSISFYIPQCFDNVEASSVTEDTVVFNFTYPEIIPQSNPSCTVTFSGTGGRLEPNVDGIYEMNIDLAYSISHPTDVSLCEGILSGVGSEEEEILASHQ